MRSMIGAMLLLALTAACASNEDDGFGDGETETDMMTDGAGVGAGESLEQSRARTERRLQLERSVDQWYLAFQRQEYGKAEGLASALEQFVVANFELVRTDLGADSPRFRKVSAAALGFSRKQEAVEPLVGALRDPYADVVGAALLSLGRLAQGGLEVPATAVTPYLGHSSTDIRNNAAYVLVHATKKGQGELFLPLTAAMEDEDPSVRLHVAAALGALGDPDALPFLLRGLDDRLALVRIRSAYALGRIGDTRAVPPLIAALDDPSADVSKAAHKALMTLTDREFERRRSVWEDYWSRKDR